MTKSSDDNTPPSIKAVQWVSRITTVAVEMVLPGVVGLWLDARWGTQFLMIVGFGLGLVLGMWHLLHMFPPKSTRRDK